ncbi:hypothetical protein ACTAZI_15630 [Legionella bozemanae]|uniref:hypothetical protein n=1 Tax=Legionella bozemanae TaxID=447 RepID=UPI003EE84A1B
MSSKIKQIARSEKLHTKHDKFTRHLIKENILASNNVKNKNFDLNNAEAMSIEGLAALGAIDGLQSMLAAQMLSIHQLQQKSMTFANAVDDIQIKQYYINAAIKLGNCFVQQASLLAKLQGIGGQKIIVERVDVHQGGQAIVGNIQGGMGN